MERNEPPRWLQDKHFNEVLFCEDFLSAHPMVCVGGSFFTVEGRVADEEGIRKQIYEMLRPHFTSGTARRATTLKRSGWRPTRRSCPFRRTVFMLPTARCFSMVSFVSKKNSAATVSPSDMTPARRSRRRGCGFCLTCWKRRTS